MSKGNLVVDMGNTLTKVALFENGQLQDFIRLPGSDYEQLNKIFQNYPDIHACMISSVGETKEAIYAKVITNSNLMFLDNSVMLPFVNKYSTPLTLGNDRLAGMAAARELFPGQNVLVVDTGTAITFDLMNSYGEYLGGSIAPGIAMRYKALNTFTQRLPLLEKDQDNVPLIGNSTLQCIHSGVLNGVVHEVEGMINSYLEHFPDLNIILTGGDQNYFDKQLKIKTFAAPNLVLFGLNILLNYNLENQEL
ncbi:MAG: type III pantothenate kinase [Bacteroidales bacterium]|nr:type III pantothenate kinase [Bacteroidales bacterium]